MSVKERFSKGEDAAAWVEEVSKLQSRIHEKLLRLSYLRPGEDDDVSHRLAEVSYTGSFIASRLLPAFLCAEGTELSELSADLVEDLREMKESIEAMEDHLVLLMNQLNP